MTSLPLELLLLVISFTADRKDDKSLRNLSLACSAFREPCQRLLLSHIRVAISHPRSPGSIAPPGERLLELLLASSSRIASYVKHITMFDAKPRWAGWLANDRKLAKALDQFDLTKIEAFTLVCINWGTFGSLAGRLKEIIVRICQSPALRTLSLSRAPLELVRACGSSLKQFQVENCFPQGGANGEGIPPLRESQVVILDSLQLDYTISTISTVHFILQHLRTIRVDKLRTLHLFASDGSEPEDAMTTLVAACQNSVKTLNLMPCVNGSNPGESVFGRIPRCPNLTTLGIEVDTTTPARESLPGTASLIERLAPPNSIQVIHLTIYFDLRKIPGDCGLDGTLGGFWSWELRGIGECVTAFPHLRTFILEIHSPNDSVEAIRAWAVEALAIPPERNILEVA